MIRLLAIMAAIAVLVFIVYQEQGEGPIQGNDQRIETGWGELDSLVADALPDRTEATLSSGMDESADMIRGWGYGAVGEVQAVAPRR
jgi:hypothetical protein